MEIGNGKFWLGDCLELMKNIPDNSVDMILCDLPYGTTACKWDTIIPFEPLWKQYWRIAKPNAAVVLTASQPFTTALISSQIKHFKYEWIWQKSKSTGHLHSKHMPMKEHENVCVFYKKQCTYNAQKTKGKSFKGRKNIGSRGNFSIEFKGSDENVRYDNTTGARYPKSIQFFKNAQYEIKTVHPTQKPVELFKYLIKTYTNQGETVLDNCAGSGTTAVACEQTNRKWICIEKEPEYYYPACLRVAGVAQ